MKLKEFKTMIKPVLSMTSRRVNYIEAELIKRFKSWERRQKKNSFSIQCRKIAKGTGRRCKNYTNYSNGYCAVHQDIKE